MSIVIVGGGLAGLTAAASLREFGYQGELHLLGDEPHLPYDRPPLSKGYLLGEVNRASLTLRSGDAWESLSVRHCASDAITGIDPVKRIARSGDGAEYRYDQLVWATGGTPRPFSGPGADLNGVHYLRNMKDADRLRSSLESVQQAVIVGGGYIGLEVAAALVQRGIAVTVLEAQERLLERVTSDVVSAYYHDVHTAQGVDIKLAQTAAAFHGRNGRLESVELADGTVIPAQLVVVGIGLVPSIQSLADAGASCSNGVDTDSLGRTSLPYVWSAGDCANFESQYTHGRRMRVESVHNATQRARRVAAAIAGTDLPTEEAPWAWSNQYDVKLKSTGLIGTHDRVIHRGDVRGGRFSVLYLQEGRLVAVDTVNLMRDYAQARKLLAQAPRIAADRATDASIPLTDLVVA
jgi:3-phenylpropionate/trans-cinnamate dioxygenase ferredoxin reductase component